MRYPRFTTAGIAFPETGICFFLWTSPIFCYCFFFSFLTSLSTVTTDHLWGGLFNRSLNFFYSKEKSRKISCHGFRQILTHVDGPILQNVRIHLKKYPQKEIGQARQIFRTLLYLFRIFFDLFGSPLFYWLFCQPLLICFILLSLLLLLLCGSLF